MSLKSLIKKASARMIGTTKPKSLREERKATKASQEKADMLFGKMVLSKAKAAFKTKYGRAYDIKMLGDVGKLTKLQGKMAKTWKHLGTTKWKGKEELGL